MRGDEIALGMSVEDKITGVKGVVTGLSYFITGCSRAGIEIAGEVDKSVWIDTPRLKVLKKRVFDFGEESKQIGGGRDPSARPSPQR